MVPQDADEDEREGEDVHGAWRSGGCRSERGDENFLAYFDI